MNFVAIDLETANPDMSSICQIGAAAYENGALIDDWMTYVNPEEDFDMMNILIHGIDEDAVKGAPTLPDVAAQLYAWLDGRIAVCHTYFDRVALKQACNKYDLRPPMCTWLDSACVTRRTWKEFAWSGYGLSNMCLTLGYEFRHHDALEDAKAAAFILLSAIKESGIDLEGWLSRVKQPIDPTSTKVVREGNPEGVLFGEEIVFTGSLTVLRKEAADMAASIGCRVKDSITKSTTLLVVGDQDIKKLAGHTKSSKHRKAEKLIQAGQTIRIMRETDFIDLCDLHA